MPPSTPSLAALASTIGAAAAASASLDRVDEGLGGIDPVALVGSTVMFVVSLVVAQALQRRHTERTTLDGGIPTT